jgi:hypothetical protein
VLGPGGALVLGFAKETANSSVGSVRRLVRKDWNLWIAWFCSEKNNFGTLSLMLVGIQRSLKGQFCLLAQGSKPSCFEWVNILIVV